MPTPRRPTADARCPWAGDTPGLYWDYHDTEWGVPSRDDQHLFEMLILEGAQAGLSWATILNKRARYRVVYDGFDPAKVARFTDARNRRLLADAGIVRNRLKVAAAVTNAKAFLAVQAEHGSFADYLWAFVDGRPIQNHFRRMADVPAETPLAKAISKDLKRRGFTFVGPTIAYAYMQSVGLVNDHLVTCPRHAVCAEFG
ncbi:MAG: DNA-3-methyladenine glycosylase I [Planctomycetota bacterium]